jgi:hypothetical protein
MTSTTIVTTDQPIAVTTGKKGLVATMHFCSSELVRQQLCSLVQTNMNNLGAVEVL